MLATRFSNSFCVSLPSAVNATGMLVKIYPASPLDRPIELNDQPIIVGREDGCELTLPEDSVSRRHARIVSIAGEMLLQDLGSTNGTYVNESRITDRKLEPGDRVRFGNQIFKFITMDNVESQYHEVIFKTMTTDGLTQTYNKRFLLDAVDRTLAQCQRNEQSFCLMMMDLDKFKSINDTYGHLAGDAVLSEFARRASSVLRSGELLARYGGEEFSMLCAPATLEQACVAAERVRAITESTPVTFESTAISMTVSIGVVACSGTTEISTNELFAAADGLLYRAKQNGRNQIQSAVYQKL